MTLWRTGRRTSWAHADPHGREGNPRKHPVLAADGEGAFPWRRESAGSGGAARMNLQAQPNLLDRVVGYFAPEWGAARMRARMVMAIAGSWAGASFTRRSLRDWFVTPASADEDTVHDLDTLRARSRDMVRNAPLATGAVNTVVMNVVGTGLSLLPRPDWEALGMTEEQADEWTAQVEREFRVWAESAECDITRTQNFYGLQSLVFRSALESGDAFVLLPMIEGRTNPYALRKP